MKGGMREAGLALAVLVSSAVSAHATGQPLTVDELARLKKYATQTTLSFENYAGPIGLGSIGLIGFQFDQFVTDHIYWGPAIFGAVTGNRGGYGIAAIGVGHQLRILPCVYWDSKLLAGSGGGSGVHTGGGFLVHGVTGVQVEMFSGLRVAMHGGYLDFPTGGFRTPVASIALVFTGRKVSLPY